MPNDTTTPIEPEIVEKDQDAKFAIVRPDSIKQLVTAEVDVQVATAHQYPRSIRQFRHDMAEWACLDQETAESCYYQLRRGGKKIQGPSVRLAEIAATCYGNFRHGSDILAIDRRFVTARGFAWDLQRNVATSCQIKRRITNSEGKTYSDDMIGVTCNAAASIAMRNATFDVVPFALIKPTYFQCIQVALGKDMTHQQRIEGALAWYEQVGAKPEQVFAAIGRKGAEDVTTEDLIFLRGQKTAIREGSITLEEALRPPNTESRGGPRVQPVSVRREETKPEDAPTQTDGKADSPSPNEATSTETTGETNGKPDPQADQKRGKKRK